MKWGFKSIVTLGTRPWLQSSIFKLIYHETIWAPHACKYVWRVGDNFMSIEDVLCWLESEVETLNWQKLHPYQGVSRQLNVQFLKKKMGSFKPKGKKRKEGAKWMDYLPISCFQPSNQKEVNSPYISVAWTSMKYKFDWKSTTQVQSK